MRVCELKLSHFRNYRELRLQFGEGINIFYGRNAQGKTNILEAISLLATTRSLRASRESELILQDEEMAHVTAEIDREREGDAELTVSVFQGDKKTVRVNGMKRERVVDLLGQFNAVFFGSIDLVIVTGEPADRRHYLNIEISQISPRYVYDLGHYKRVLAQRNRLLRELRDRPRPPQEMGLDVWNEQLIKYGSTLFDKRRFYLDRLSLLAEEIHAELTDGRERLEVKYLPSITLPVKPTETKTAETVELSTNLSTVSTMANNNTSSVAEVNPNTVRESREDAYLHSVAQEASQGEKEPAPQTQNSPAMPVNTLESIESAFRRQLHGVGTEEARRGTTLLGPQRDDIAFFINGTDARLYGSQGQQRTVALALKLAEFRLIEEHVGEPPVMLLDDVMSDLDDHRRKHLLSWVRRRCQTFITCTNLRSFPKDLLAEASIFQVTAGTVTSDVRKRPLPTRNSESLPEQSVGQPVEPSGESSVGELAGEAPAIAERHDLAPVSLPAVSGKATDKPG
ncbi:MAG: DNA replication/repair protein RecF [Chthonomonadaceae bacterium]|nr:DNA replication/repair protein RecF [Chthonomonadaceae bacterium]